MAKKKVEYDESSMKSYSGTKAVRKRYSMYVGIGESALQQLAYEILSNSVDEALGGHADRIDLKLYKDNSISIRDNGRGIPYKDTKGEKGKPISACVLAATSLHAGKLYCPLH